MKKDPCVFRLGCMFSTCEAGGPGEKKRKSEGQKAGRQTGFTVVPRTGRRKAAGNAGDGRDGSLLNMLPG